MYYSRDHNVLFVRVPCTGSTSIVRHLGFESLNGASDHQPARDFGQWDEYSAARKVGFIRHPVEWVTTVYSAHKMWKAWGIKKGRVLLDHELAAEMLTPLHWLTDEEGGLLVDEVWRTEDMEDFFRELGFKGDIPQENMTRNRKLLSRKAVSVIAERFEQEWEYYD